MIVLPASPDDPRPPPRAQVPFAQRGHPSVTTRRLRVIVVDDEPALREAMIDSLRVETDFEIVGEAGDTQGAVALTREVKPDVVLLDVRMPGGGGPLAAREISEMAPDARIVAVTAYEDARTVLEMVEAGAVGYIVKGSPELELIEAVRRAGRGQASLPADLIGSLIRDLLAEVRERGRSEASLRRSDERFQALLRAAPDAMVIIDESG